MATTGAGGANAVGTYALTAKVGTWSPSSVGQYLEIPLPVYPGETISAVRLRVICGASDTLVAALHIANCAIGGSGGDAEPATATSAAGTTIQELAMTGLSIVVDEDHVPLVYVRATALGTGTAFVWGGAVDVS